MPYACGHLLQTVNLGIQSITVIIIIGVIIVVTIILDNVITSGVELPLTSMTITTQSMTLVFSLCHHVNNNRNGIIYIWSILL